MSMLALRRIPPCLSVLALLGCGDPTPVGAPLSRVTLVARGVVRDSAGQAVPEATIAGWSIVWRTGLAADGPDAIGTCRGSRDYDIASARADTAGRFSIDIPVSGDVARYCLAVRVIPGAPYQSTLITLDSLSVPAHKAGAIITDTLRLSIILSVANTLSRSLPNNALHPTGEVLIARKMRAICCNSPAGEG